MGILAKAGILRKAIAVEYPFSFGICRSRMTMWGAKFGALSTACAPSSASITT